MLPVPLRLRGLGPVWWRWVHHPDVSRCVEFQRDGPCRQVHAGAHRVGVYDMRGGCAVVVKEVKAQSGAAREGTEHMEHAAVATHHNGIEISAEYNGRIQALHEEGNGLRNP